MLTTLPTQTQPLDPTERRTQENILKARAYYDGEQDVKLSARLKQFLSATGGGHNFRINLCRTVVAAVAERLLVTGFAADSDSSIWASQVWQHNRMDARQDEIHIGALRDGEYFVLVDWDSSARMPRLTPHPRYTSPTTGGDGFGCRMIYPDNDPGQPPRYAVKQWTETLTSGSETITRQRRTVYHPDRIERYIHAGDDDGWQPHATEDHPAVQPWRDHAGQPLGIPVIHFRNTGLRPETWDAIPLQDAINKSLVDLLGAADMSAFQVLVALGWFPTSDDKPPEADGSNRLTLEPGQIVGTTRSKNDADLKAITAGDLSPLLELTQQLILWLAMVTDTPVSRFITSRQVASADTLRQREEPLLAKVRARQVLFGNAWEDTLTIARRLANYFTYRSWRHDEPFSTEWKQITARRDGHISEEWRTKHALGVPEQQLWREMGYSEPQIANMLRLKQGAQPAIGDTSSETTQANDEHTNQPTAESPNGTLDQALEQLTHV